MLCRRHIFPETTKIDRFDPGSMTSTKPRANSRIRRSAGSAKRSTTKAGGPGVLSQRKVTISCALPVKGYGTARPAECAPHRAFVASHRDEVLGLARNEENRIKAEHPLARIIKIENQAEAPVGVVITTTDPHLARRIGEALHHAHHGNFTCRYVEHEDLLRANWETNRGMTQERNSPPCRDGTAPTLDLARRTVIL